MVELYFHKSNLNKVKHLWDNAFFLSSEKFSILKGTIIMTTSTNLSIPTSTPVFRCQVLLALTRIYSNVFKDSMDVFCFT